MTPGQRVREARERLKLSPGELAKGAAMREAYLVQIESDEVPGVNVRTLQKLADALGVRIEYILGQEELPEKQTLADSVPPEYLWFVRATMCLVVALGTLCLLTLISAIGAALVVHFEILSS